jgi:arylsulfatase A-like enzyme
VHCHFYYPYYLVDDREKFLLPGNFGGRRGQYTHDVIVEKALEFVRESKDGAFFLYLPFTIPHTELLVPEDSLREYWGKFPEPTPWVCPRRHYADQPAPRAAFAAMVTRMDRDVGRILALLEKLDLENNTIVFFTSDNGGQDGGGPDLAFFEGNRPLRGSKGHVYEGGIRVPMLVRWPGHVAAGAVSDHVWAFWDVLPTLAELGGADVPEGLDGISVVPTLLGAEAAGQSQKKHRFLYWEQPRGRGLTQGVRMGDWKAVHLRSDTPLELYNLKEDVGETTNVAGEHPDVVAEIEDYFGDARTEPRQYEAEPPTWGYPREKTGYLR